MYSIIENMEILKDRKRQEVRDIFKTCDEFINFLMTINDKINFKSKFINDKIYIIYDRMLNDDGIIKWVRFDRWLPSQFGFKESNLLTINFWLERGWSEENAKIKISNIIKKRAVLSNKTKSIKKNKIEFGNDEVIIKFKGGEFKTNVHPKCNICHNNLILLKKNINNQSDLFYLKIVRCSNEFCETKKYSKTDLYRAYLPKRVAETKIKELNNIIINYNHLCVDSWLNKNYTKEDAIREISKIQSKNSLMVKNRFIVSKNNLKKRGYSDEKIKQICLTPSQNEFWLNKGYSEKNAKKLVISNQLNALKYVDYNNRLLPSNIDYWIKKGFTYYQAKEKVSERQSTFSLEKCIEKYGEEEGRNRFNERQFKWLNNYKKNSFSKISQELFWGILKTEPLVEKNKIYFATYNNGIFDNSRNNNEYRLKLNNGIILPDFFDLNNKKIIEFDGTYYHRKTPENISRDKKRDKMILESGYKVLHINEIDFKKNKQKEINKCIGFLKTE